MKPTRSARGRRRSRPRVGRAAQPGSSQKAALHSSGGSVACLLTVGCLGSTLGYVCVSDVNLGGCGCDCSSLQDTPLPSLAYHDPRPPVLDSSTVLILTSALPKRHPAHSPVLHELPQTHVKHACENSAVPSNSDHADTSPCPAGRRWCSRRSTSRSAASTWTWRTCSRPRGAGSDPAQDDGAAGGPADDPAGNAMALPQARTIGCD